MPTKTELMESVAAGKTIEAFTHETEGTFHVTAMREHAITTHRRIHMVPITPEVIHFLRECRDVEEERIERLTFKQIGEPAIAIELKDHTHLLIDGTHRILRLHRMGALRFPVWMFSHAEAEDFRAIEPDNVTEKPQHQWGNMRVVAGKLVRAS